MSLENSSRPRWAIVALAAICLIWAGMLLFNIMSIPLRFGAPSLKEAVTPELGRAISLDIGRVTFLALSKVEMVWSLATLLLLFVARPFSKIPRPIITFFALVWPIVLLQGFVLIPALAARSQMIMKGQTPPPAPYHMLYSTTEIIKLVSLIILGVLLIKASGLKFEEKSVA